MNEWPVGRYLHFNLYIHTGWQIEVREIVDRLRIRIQDVDEPLVNPHLVLVTRVLVNECRPVDRHLVNFGRERDGTGDFGTCPFGCLDDFPSRLVDDFVVIGLDLDPDPRQRFFFFLRSHDCE